MKPGDLDAIDRRILAELQRDGRIAMVDLAERVGLSATPCQRRVKRLESCGVIAGYGARIDQAKLGQRLQAFVQVVLDDHSEETVAGFQQALLACPEVVACVATSGEMDYLLVVVAPDLEAFSRFALDALLRMPGVRSTKTSFTLRVIKPGPMA